jgi:hypothetical protein
MKAPGAFISFEFDRDYELKENFVRQAELRTSAISIEDTSLKHSYPDSE